MATKKKWTPTQKQIDKYNELVKQSNKLRRKLLRRRKELEREVGSGRLPDLVVPALQKGAGKINWRRVTKDIYWKKIKELQKVVTGGLEGWYKTNYKNKILSLWRDKLGVIPEGFNGFKYSPEQMKLYPELTRFMEAYNKLFSMPIGTFMYMYDRGYLPAFKYIYNEMGGVSGDKVYEAGYLEQLEDAIKMVSRIAPKDYLEFKPDFSNRNVKGLEPSYNEALEKKSKREERQRKREAKLRSENRK